MSFDADEIIKILELMVVEGAHGEGPYRRGCESGDLYCVFCDDSIDAPPKSTRRMQHIPDYDKDENIKNECPVALAYKQMGYKWDEREGWIK